MKNTSSQTSQSNGDINYLIIEYLKSIPFSDNNQKEKLIKNVSEYIFNISILFLSYYVMIKFKYQVTNHNIFQGKNIYY